MNRWVAIGVGLWLSLASAQAQDLTQKARQALQSGHTEQAANMLQEQVKVSPRDYQAWFLLGVSQAKIQRYHPAIESFRRVLELRPDLAEPHNNLAVIYNELGDVPAAIVQLEASLKKHPDYLVAEENIADLYLKMALTYYKKALEQTDDASLQERYRRLLQVRDVSVGQAVAASHPAEPARKPVQVNDKPKVEVAEARPALPTVDSILAQAHPKTNPQALQQAALDEVGQAVEAWRQAWVSQNLPAYFASYADDYMPPAKFKNRQAWEQYKARVIGNKRFIKVSLRHIKIKVSDDWKHAVVQFDQSFHSNSYNGDDKKQLAMMKVDGAWKIAQEVTR